MPKKPPIKQLPQSEDEQRLQIFERRAAPLSVWDTVRQIASDDHANTGAEALKLVKDLLDAVEADRKSITGPLNTALREVNARYKKLTEPLQARADKIVNLLRAYENAQRQKAVAAAQKEAKAAIKRGETQYATDIVEAAVFTPAVDLDALGQRQVWKARVTNPAKLLQALADGTLPVDLLDRAIEGVMPGLNKLAQLHKESTPKAVPGVEAYLETQFSRKGV